MHNKMHAPDRKNILVLSCGCCAFGRLYCLQVIRSEVFSMTNGDIEYEVRKPGIFVVFATIISGSAIAFILASYMLNLSPAWIALLAGAVSSFLGFFILGESIVDALVFSISFLVLVFVFITVGPEIKIIRMNIVPIATGICVGKLTHGIWKEIR